LICSIVLTAFSPRDSTQHFIQSAQSVSVGRAHCHSVRIRCWMSIAIRSISLCTVLGAAANADIGSMKTRAVQRLIARIFLTVIIRMTAPSAPTRSSLSYVVSTFVTNCISHAVVAVSRHSAWEFVGSVCVSIPNHVVIHIPPQAAIGQIIVVLAAAIPFNTQCIGCRLTLFRRRYEHVIATRVLGHHVLH